MRLNFAALSNPMQKGWGQVGTLGTVNKHGALTRPQFIANGGDTRGHVSATVMEEKTETLDLSPMSPSCPPPWGHGTPCVHAVVPAVPNVPTKKHMNEIDCEAFEERAAIMEFDGGVSRAEAEQLAAVSLGMTVQASQ